MCCISTKMCFRKHKHPVKMASTRTCVKLTQMYLLEVIQHNYSILPNTFIVFLHDANVGDSCNTFFVFFLNRGPAFRFLPSYVPVQNWPQRPTHDYTYISILIAGITKCIVYGCWHPDSKT